MAAGNGRLSRIHCQAFTYGQKAAPLNLGTIVEGAALQSQRENYSLQLSPGGTAESSPGRESWVSVRQRVVPQGRLKITQDAILGYFYLRKGLITIRSSQPRTMSWVTFSRPYGTSFVSRIFPQDCVLGYSQPSLRDSIWRG
jgi:hypothetical protein